MGARPRALAAALVLVAVALGLSVELTRIHYLTHTDPQFASICAINDAVDCEAVARSPYAVFLGVPVSVWGLLGYLTMGGFALWGLLANRLHDAWPLGILFWLFAGSLAASIPLGYVSATRIDSICIWCTALYAVNAALFLDGFVLLRTASIGPLAAIAKDLAAMSGRPAIGLLVVALAAAFVAVPMAAIPAYWDRMSHGWSELPRLPTGIDDEGCHWIGAATPLVTVVEFSDYECPYCRMAHQEIRALAARYPDEVRLVHRHLPLDQACNPLVNQPFHQRACEFSKAAECGGEQGMFWKMNDALYSVQDQMATADVDLDDIAVSVGLDRSTFRSCMARDRFPECIRADLAQAKAKKVAGTPTYFIHSESHLGGLPPGALKAALTRARSERRP
jgi:uncharacterized membrane protein/predicted DsbA family dithiol-disulfide isomerase